MTRETDTSRRCKHGVDRYACEACHRERRAAGLYGPTCPRSEHDFPPTFKTWVSYYCQKCGEYARWDD
jgi:ribosomal protein L44E